MRRFFRYLRTRPLGLVSVAVLFVLYFVMVFAEFFAPYSATTSFSKMTYHPPNVRVARGGVQAQVCGVVDGVSWKYVRIKDEYHRVGFFVKGERYKLWGLVDCDRHFFGTVDGEYPAFALGADNLGRDVFSRIVYGSRISLTIGFIATAISLLLAVIFGGLAGYFGGLTDWGIMRFSEFFMLIPGLYLILFLRSLLSTSMDSGQSYMVITLILSLVGWPGSARTVRGLVHSIKREEFVLNAQLEGMPSMVIIFRHIIPQMTSLLIVSVALSVPGFIMSETTLSYLGLGIVDPAVSWGSLIKRDVSTLANLRSYPWLLNPVWLLLLVTLAFNFLGDVLRDFYDPYHAAFPKLRLFSRIGKKRLSVAAGEGLVAGDGAEDGAVEPAGVGDVFLEVRNLRVSFDAIRAVRGVSFSLARGEILGIVGESGSGKSVSTSAIPGLLPSTAQVSGSIRIEGMELVGLDVQSLRKWRGKRIGMIFQEPGRSYDPLQTIGKMFFETFRNSEPNLARAEADERTARLLEEVGLSNAVERLSGFPHQFSGGQLQRIGIALALAQGCDLLIADEPTTALDVTIQAQIVGLLRKIRDDRHISIIFISHNIDLVAGISDRIMVMYGGLVMESGASRDIVSVPRHPYTQALLAAAPRFGEHCSASRLTSIPGKVPDPANPEPGCPFAPRCPRAVPECRSVIPAIVRTGATARSVRCVLETEERR